MISPTPNEFLFVAPLNLNFQGYGLCRSAIIIIVIIIIIEKPKYKIA